MEPVRTKFVSSQVRRRAVSCTKFSLDEEFNQSEDSVSEVQPTRRMSHPTLEKDFEDPLFANEMGRIRKTMQELRYFNNCYAEPKPIDVPDRTFKRKKRLIHRRTQTYLRELLWKPGEEVFESNQVIELGDEPEVEQAYATGLVQGVIDGISVDSKPKGMRRRKKRKSIDLEEVMGD